MSYIVRSIVAPSAESAGRRIADPDRARPYKQLSSAQDSICAELSKLKRRYEALGDTGAVVAIEQIQKVAGNLLPGRRLSGVVDPYSGWHYLAEIEQVDG